MLQLELLPNECIRLRYLRLNYILNSDLKINDMLFGGLMQYGFCRLMHTEKFSCNLYLNYICNKLLPSVTS